MDHDRSSGENVGPQEYTLIKMKIANLKGKLACLSHFKNVYLIAATLRPETMYGQTNCWVGPDLTYLAVESYCPGEIFITTYRAARNMAFQGILAVENEVKPILQVKGTDLMGLELSAPLSSYSTVYTLPMLTVKEDKGTGVVTSVPSDSPDDFSALEDLKNKPALREKYGITEAMVVGYEAVPIIQVPDYGNLSAPYICREMGIKSQNDREKLETAKLLVYRKGFDDGVMLVGEFKGQKIKDIKKQVQNYLVKEKLALTYQEPERKVVSRSGDECVVALCDQWYLDYGKDTTDDPWLTKTREALDKLNTFNEQVRNNFIETLNWLKGHACSRTYGLGTRLPWDEQWLIESLSDSTIYMAYYTVCHILHDDFDGSGGNRFGIKPDDMTPSSKPFL